jgi:hypothetical protein
MSGVTDDTAALNNLFAQYSGCKIIFLDAGKRHLMNAVSHANHARRRLLCHLDDSYPGYVLGT